MQETDNVKVKPCTEWSTGEGGFLSLREGDTQDDLGPTRRRRLSGRVEEIVLRI